MITCFTYKSRALKTCASQNAQVHDPASWVEKIGAGLIWDLLRLVLPFARASCTYCGLTKHARTHARAHTHTHTLSHTHISARLRTHIIRNLFGTLVPWQQPGSSSSHSRFAYVLGLLILFPDRHRPCCRLCSVVHLPKPANQNLRLDAPVLCSLLKKHANTPCETWTSSPA